MARQAARTQENDARGSQRSRLGAAARDRLVTASGLAERHVDLAGMDTAVLEGGNGPPIVLLHGQGEFWAVWLGVIDDLVRTHRLVVVDLPGHGASAVGSARLDNGAMVAWLDDLVTATCDEQPVIVGHLLGGAIAARHAVAHGDRVAHLVLVDTLGLGWFRPSLRFAVPMVRFLVRPTPQSRDRLFRECFVDCARRSLARRRRIGSHHDQRRHRAHRHRRRRHRNLRCAPHARIRREVGSGHPPVAFQPIPQPR